MPSAAIKSLNIFGEIVQVKALLGKYFKEKCSSEYYQHVLPQKIVQLFLILKLLLKASKRQTTMETGIK